MQIVTIRFMKKTFTALFKQAFTWTSAFSKTLLPIDYCLKFHAKGQKRSISKLNRKKKNLIAFPCFRF